MITRTEYISNNHCTVNYIYHNEGVIVQTPDFLRQRIFGGYPGILERFRELADSFSEQISYEDACKYFTLTKEEYETHQPQ